MTPTIVNGYAEITRTWARGDRVQFDVPMTPQVIRGSEKIEAVRGKVALRLGPLVYNIEKVDQDITEAIDLASPLSVEFRNDLLDGVPGIKGRFTDGSRLLAVPNLVRMNRNPPAPPPPPPVPAGQPRPAPPPAASIVWITEGK